MRVLFLIALCTLACAQDLPVAERFYTYELGGAAYQLYVQTVEDDAEVRIEGRVDYYNGGRLEEVVRLDAEGLRSYRGALVTGLRLAGGDTTMGLRLDRIGADQLGVEAYDSGSSGSRRIPLERPIFAGTTHQLHLLEHIDPTQAGSVLLLQVTLDGTSRPVELRPTGRREILEDGREAVLWVLEAHGEQTRIRLAPEGGAARLRRRPGRRPDPAARAERGGGAAAGRQARRPRPGRAPREHGGPRALRRAGAGAPAQAA